MVFQAFYEFITLWIKNERGKGSWVDSSKDSISPGKSTKERASPGQLSVNQQYIMSLLKWETEYFF